MRKRHPKVGLTEIVFPRRSENHCSTATRRQPCLEFIRERCKDLCIAEKFTLFRWGSFGALSRQPSKRGSTDEREPGRATRRPFPRDAAARLRYPHVSHLCREVEE